MENVKKIPKITINYFEEVYISHVLDTLRIDRSEFEKNLNSDEITSLNKKAERYITTYLKNRTDNLTEDNWMSAKELYIQWKLFEGIELEKESIDKKESLIELLELFRNEVIELEEDSISKKKEASSLYLVGGKKKCHYW